jgi:DNA-directed RNA polymerase specialized sigma24 family protein
MGERRDMEISPMASDEALIISIRQGNEEAQSILAIRYYQKRFFHAARVAPNTYRLMDPCDFGSLYFRVYLACENHYLLGEFRFQSYFESCLKRALAKEVEELIAERRRILSLDTPLPGNDNSMLSLHDVVAADQNPHDPKIYLNYCETLERLSKLPRQISPRVLRLVDLHVKGLTYREAEKRLHIPSRTAKTMLTAYRKFVRGLIKKERVDILIRP